MTGTTLGLDLGPNSIGWALIDEALTFIVATGVRVFTKAIQWSADRVAEQSFQPSNGGA